MGRSLKIILCVLTIVSLMTLVACTTSDTAGNTEPQEQNMSDTQPTTQPNTQKTAALSYDVKFIQTDHDDSVTYPQIQLLSLDETNKIVDDLKALRTQYQGAPATPGAGIEELNYDEAYFEKKSLALIQTTIPMDVTLTVSQVTFDGKTLNVFLEQPAVSEGTVSLSAFGYWCMFIEINEKLPDTATGSVEIIVASANS